MNPEKRGLRNFSTYLDSTIIYSQSQIQEVMDIVRPNFTIAKTKEGIKYFNVPFAFDTEVSSFYVTQGAHADKACCMYAWGFNIYGLCILGRTWEEFSTLIADIVRILQLHVKKRIILYVHNLAYDFQFFRKYFTFEKVFAIDSRKPVYAITTEGVEFRCSYILSGYSLENLGKNLLKYKVAKKVGDLDYGLMRHTETELTDKEIGYIMNDVRVVSAYIAEKIEMDGDITKVLLTKTSYTRQYCRNMCFYQGLDRKEGFYHRLEYRDTVSKLTLDLESYKQCKRAYMGGFTHCNSFCANKVLTDVTSSDFTSSYPYVIVSEKFPMSAPELVYIDSEIEFLHNLNHYCCIFDIHITGLEPKVWHENYLSESKCWGKSGDIQVNNGRVVSASWIQTTITEQDYIIMTQMYTWTSAKVGEFRRYRKDYLPRPFVQAVLRLYADKTRLKGEPGEEVNYMMAKENVNSCYGMMVTDIVHENHEYTDHWLEGDEAGEFTDAQKSQLINKYNVNPSRFLYYPWGVYVTAYARRNLFTAILACGADYVYSDTDSCKITNYSDHKEYYDLYNKTVISKLTTAMEYQNLPLELCMPKTVKDVVKPLGVWEKDAHYSRFKSLGAKRYMVEYSDSEVNEDDLRGKINITVSGLNKKKAVPYLLETYGEKVFDAFKDEMTVPAAHSGRPTLTYIDEEMEGELTDHNGVTARFHELSGVHMENSSYTMSMSDEYVRYIMAVHEWDI